MCFHEVYGLVLGSQELRRDSRGLNCGPMTWSHILQLSEMVDIEWLHIATEHMEWCVYYWGNCIRGRGRGGHNLDSLLAKVFHGINVPLYTHPVFFNKHSARLHIPFCFSVDAGNHGQPYAAFVYAFQVFHPYRCSCVSKRNTFTRSLGIVKITRWFMILCYLIKGNSSLETPHKDGSAQGEACDTQHLLKWYKFVFLLFHQS